MAKLLNIKNFLAPNLETNLQLVSQLTLILHLSLILISNKNKTNQKYPMIQINKKWLNQKIKLKMCKVY